MTLTAENVLVSFNFAYLGSGSCPGSNFWCIRTSATIQVTPCPPGVPCSGGSYTFTVQAPDWQQITLDLDTSYSFSGTWKKEFGYVNVNPCTYSCSSTGSLIPRTYDTPETAPYWELTQVSMDENVVVLDAVLKNFVTLTCPGGQCAARREFLKVEPCAVDINGWGSQCTAGGAYSQADLPYPDVIRVTLLKGQAYTFSGGATIMGFRPELGGGCFEPACNWFGPAAPVVYTGTSVATHQTTWGAVKALYQDP